MRKTPLYVKILLIITILLLLVNISLTIMQRNSGVMLDQKVRTYLSEIKIPVPKDGEAGVVDYKTIQQYIDQKIASIPPAKNGSNGSNGNNGLNGESIVGPSGSSCTTHQLENGAAITCTDGSSSIITNGSNGVDGQDGPKPLIRCNDVKNRWEIRYSEDETWKIMDNKSVQCKGLPIPLGV